MWSVLGAFLCVSEGDVKGCTGRGEKWVLCPYFRAHSLTEVRCEGLPLSSGLRMAFDDRESLKRFEKTFCMQNFKCCRLFEAISQQYADDP